jgi:hypothetical protein
MSNMGHNTQKQFYIYEETTHWQQVPCSDNYNHVYVFTERPTGRMATVVAYVKRGTKELFRFGGPRKIDLKGRTFKPLD